MRPTSLWFKKVVAAIILGCAALFSVAHADEADDRQILRFAETCLSGSSFAELEENAARHGWTATTPEVDDELKRIVLDAASLTPDGWTSVERRVYARSTPGERTFLSLTSFISDTGPLLGCYVYRFDAAMPMKVETLQAITGEAPSSRQDFPPLLTSAEWRPATKWPQLVFIRYGHLAPDAPVMPGFVHGSSIVTWIKPAAPMS